MEEKTIANKLQELFELYKSGALSKDEFDQLKAEIINEEQISPIENESNGKAINTNSIKKNKNLIIKEAIDLVIDGKYDTALQMLLPYFNYNKSNDLDYNRGLLYLTYCISQSSFYDISKTIEHLSYIDFGILKQNHEPIDENILIKILDEIISKSLAFKYATSMVMLKSIEKICININDYLYDNNKYKLAEIWYNLGLKQLEFKIFNDAIVSFQKAKEITPEVLLYKNKYDEVIALIDLLKTKKKRKKIIGFVSIPTFVLIVILSVYAYRYYVENSKFKNAIKENTISALQNYLAQYPNGRYINEVKSLKEKIIIQDSVDRVSLKKIHLKYLSTAHNKTFQGRNTNIKILFADLNNDGINEAFIDYCIEPNDKDYESTGGGTVWNNIDCIDNGFCIYEKKGDNWILKIENDKNKFAEGINCNVDTIIEGKIYCLSDDYDNEDPRCCPTLIKKIYLVYENGKLNKPLQKIEIIKRNQSNETNSNETNTVSPNNSSEISSENLVEDNTIVTDIDGNQYHTVTIGKQVWMKENLKTTKFNDGKAISNISDNSSWAVLTTPAYCWYNNSQEKYGNTSGALYNWYTVNTGKLCPIGWHVPTNDEYIELIKFLGGGTSAQLKVTESGTLHWKSKYNPSNNSTGFSALPSGFRSEEGKFYFVGESTDWWSSTDCNMNNAWNSGIEYNVEFGRHCNSKKQGFPIRCVKD